MGTVVSLDHHRKPDAETLRLYRLGADLDAIIVQALADEMGVLNVAGVLAHRLGNLVAHTDQPVALWEVCWSIIRKRFDEIFRKTPR